MVVAVGAVLVFRGARSIFSDTGLLSMTLPFSFNTALAILMRPAVLRLVIECRAGGLPYR